MRDEESFVIRTALNLSIDAYRHAHSELYVQEPLESLQLIDINPTPDEVFATEERLHRMKAVLDRASLRSWDIFIHASSAFSGFRYKCER